MQLQSMNSMMTQQLTQYPVQTAMIPGIAGGNGLEHIDPQKFQKVYGADINRTYLRPARPLPRAGKYLGMRL